MFIKLQNSKDNIFFFKQLKECNHTKVQVSVFKMLFIFFLSAIIFLSIFSVI